MDSKLTEIPTEEVVIYPYSSSRRVTYLFSTPDTSDPSPLRGTPTPRDPSLYFTIARVLITRSFNLFPVCDPDLIQDRGTFGLPGMFYYHTHVLQVLQALIDGRCAIEKREGRVVVWFEVGEKEVEVERANERMRRYGVQVHKQTLNDD